MSIIDKIASVEVNVDLSQYPEFCDAYIESATLKDGTEATEEQLEEINEDSDFVYTETIKSIF